jgi:hypothetical protein
MAAELDAADISVTGVVKQPLNLSMDALGGFKTTRVQLNEILRDGSFRGAWFYDGVPLRTLLDTAFIEKEETAFPKAIDLAVIIRNREGQEVALSWGEIFYKNSTDVIIATSATPIKPRGKHTPNDKAAEDSNRYAEQYERKIGFPKLVVAHDGYADRSIENVVGIEVINPRPRMAADKSAKLFSPSFKVTGEVKKELTMTDLSGFAPKEIRVAYLGEGSGFHGVDRYSGISFKNLIEKAGVEPKLSSIFLISAPDGYRSTFS